MKVFVIMPDYRHNSIGIRVMHYFSYLLTLLGHEVITSAQVLNQKYKGIKIGEYTDNVDFIIAPEYVNFEGNIFKPVFRWVLFNTELKYKDFEVVYHWHKDYEESAKTASYYGKSKEFNIGYIDKNEYINNPVKTKVCYWVHKGLKQWGECPKPRKEAIEITHAFPKDRKGLMKLLSECKEFYSYDSNTAMTEEAYLSGSKVYIYKGKQINGQTEMWEEYKPQINKGNYIKLKYDLRKVKDIIRDFWYRVETNET